MPRAKPMEVLCPNVRQNKDVSVFGRLKPWFLLGGRYDYPQGRMLLERISPLKNLLLLGESFIILAVDFLLLRLFVQDAPDQIQQP